MVWLLSLSMVAALNSHSIKRFVKLTIPWRTPFVLAEVHVCAIE